MAPRKVRLTANLVKGMNVPRAKAQLAFLVRKPAPLILKLVNSAIANAKHNFDIEEGNLFIKSIMVESGATLKRWMPRAMGRATPILKRTAHIKLILDEKIPGAPVKKIKKIEKHKEEMMPAAPTEREENIFTTVGDEKGKGKPGITRPYGASSESKKRFFSRQAFGNIKKVFRRKSI